LTGEAPSPLDLTWLDGLPAGTASTQELYEQLDESGLGDGLPVALPEPGWIDEALAASGHAPDRELARIPPLRLPVTALRLAVCASLAGCRPDHYPVLAAAVGALERPELNTLGVLTTTGSAALAVIVNGPAAKHLGFNATGNLLGPGNRSNATVGRALSLVTRILAGAREGVGDMATMGQPGKYTLAFAENEDQSPWEPFHVEHGYPADTSTVTVIGLSGTQEIVDAWAQSAPEIIASLTLALRGGVSAIVHRDGVLGGGQPVLLISPEWAARLATLGISKRELQTRLHDEAAIPTANLPPTALAGATAVDADPPPLLRVAARPEDILVLVAGGVGIKQTLMPNWNGRSRAVTVPIPS
jgi:hypothetical protein